MRELSGHFADRAIESGNHCLRVALTEDHMDQRGEAAGFRLARHWELINRTVSCRHNAIDDFVEPLRSLDLLSLRAPRKLIVVMRARARQGRNFQWVGDRFR